MVTRNNIGDIAKLDNSSAIKKLVPKDTTFAVIAELTEPHFTGTAYLCVSSHQLHIVGAKGLIAKAELDTVVVKLDHGEYVIHILGHEYTIHELVVITAAGSAFTSRIAGIDGGVSPLLNALSAGGATVRGISGAKYYIAAVVLAFVFILGMGLFAYIALK